MYVNFVLPRAVANNKQKEIAVPALANWRPCSQRCIAIKYYVGIPYILEKRRRTASAQGARIEVPKAPRRVGFLGRGCPPSQPTIEGLGSVMSFPSRVRADPRPPTHSRHISWPQKPFSRTPYNSLVKQTQFNSTLLISAFSSESTHQLLKLANVIYTEIF